MDKEHDSLNSKWRNTELAAAAVGITCVALVAWPLVLGAAGWTAGGVAAGTFSSVLRLIMLTLPCIGSIAAVVQGANVAAGSLFALAQSAGAEGTVAGVIDGAIVGAGGATAVKRRNTKMMARTSAKTSARTMTKAERSRKFSPVRRQTMRLESGRSLLIAIALSRLQCRAMMRHLGPRAR
jgi:hypothetical protein